MEIPTSYMLVFYQHNRIHLVMEVIILLFQLDHHANPHKNQTFNGLGLKEMGLLLLMASTWPHFEELDSKSDITTIMFNVDSLNESIPEAM